MLFGHCIEQSSARETRLRDEAAKLRQQAEGLPPSIRRDELLRKARQAETRADAGKWLASPGLRAPT